MTNLGPLIIAKTTGARRKCFYVTITGFIFPKFSEKIFFREMKISIFIFFGLAHIILYLHGGVRESSCLDFSGLCLYSTSIRWPFVCHRIAFPMEIIQRMRTKETYSEPMHGKQIRQNSRVQLSYMAATLIERNDCSRSLSSEVIHWILVRTKSTVTPEILLYCTSRKPEELWIARIYSQNFSLPAALLRLIIDLEGEVGFSKTFRGPF